MASLRMDGPWARALVLAAGIGLLATVAALTDARSEPTGDLSLGLPSPIDAIKVVGYVAVLVGIVVVPILFLFARRQRQRGLTAPRAPSGLTSLPKWVSALGLLLLAGLFVAQLYVLATYVRDLLEARRAELATPGASLDPATSGIVGATPQSTGPLVVAVVIVVALAVIALAAAIAWRGMDGPSSESAASGPTTVAAPVVEIGLEALRADADPRRAVIAAYAAMEGTMARAGLGRDAPEAPIEYLRRVFGRWPRSAGEVARLSDLFQLAKFSRHDVDESMRDAAIDALERLRTVAGRE